jgi:hypothetical protein
MRNRLVFIGVLAGLAAAVAAGYFLVRKLQKDREAVLSYIPPDRPQPLQNSGLPKRETVTYTEKDLEEMRKKGVPAPGVKPPIGPPAAGTSGEAAVQRSLKTLEEVNRINEMNRRIQEQQERMRNQR